MLDAGVYARNLCDTVHHAFHVPPVLGGLLLLVACKEGLDCGDQPKDLFPRNLLAPGRSRRWASYLAARTPPTPLCPAEVPVLCSPLIVLPPLKLTKSAPCSTKRVRLDRGGRTEAASHNTGRPCEWAISASSGRGTRPPGRNADTRWIMPAVRSVIAFSTSSAVQWSSSPTSTNLVPGTR